MQTQKHGSYGTWIELNFRLQTQWQHVLMVASMMKDRVVRSRIEWLEIDSHVQHGNFRRGIEECILHILYTSERRSSNEGSSFILSTSFFSSRHSQERVIEWRYTSKRTRKEEVSRLLIPRMTEKLRNGRKGFTWWWSRHVRNGVYMRDPHWH